MYHATRYCQHCKADTLHEVDDSQHERDSSNDTRTCCICGWFYSGFTGKYSAPDTEESENE